MRESIETIIIGGGQAGLSLGYFLKQLGIEHLILEQAGQPVDTWRNQRWDSFTLVTPNWTFQIPGMEYQGNDPHGFLPREEIVAAFDQHIHRNRFPIRCNTRVTAVDLQPNGYRVETSQGTLDARNVVIATGLFQTPRIPPWAAGIPPDIFQVSSNQYRNPDALPEGAVLVIGSGQSGCQIAEELYQAGRVVYLSVGAAPRIPRRYRGKDAVEWLKLLGFFERTPAMLKSPAERFMGTPQLSGKGGGRSLNLHVFAREGVRLLGHFVDAQGYRARFAPDLKESLAKTDGIEKEMIASIDRAIQAHGIDAPAEEVPQYTDGYQVPPIEQLDLKAAGISTLLWACGFRFDYSIVHLPVVDEAGFPIQNHGITRYPGLYFVGLPWLYKFKSGLLMGVGEDAQFIAQQIASARTVAGQNG
ncbi:MAG: NAD(P)-binding domain-containing protein [Anaerolineaceae bacterium]|nr:NAD(P)-binding domain-containing protein [Anaerolineaceae bacterium]